MPNFDLKHPSMYLSLPCYYLKEIKNSKNERVRNLLVQFWVKFALISSVATKPLFFISLHENETGLVLYIL